MLNRIAHRRFLLPKKVSDERNYVVTAIRQIDGEFQVYLPRRIEMALIQDGNL